jgi:hypothetical protein
VPTEKLAPWQHWFLCQFTPTRCVGMSSRLGVSWDEFAPRRELAPGCEFAPRRELAPGCELAPTRVLKKLASGGVV